MLSGKNYILDRVSQARAPLLECRPLIHYQQSKSYGYFKNGSASFVYGGHIPHFNSSSSADLVSKYMVKVHADEGCITHRCSRIVSSCLLTDNQLLLPACVGQYWLIHILFENLSRLSSLFAMSQVL